MRRSAPILAKARRSFFSRLTHQWMLKFYATFATQGMESRHFFETGRDRWMEGMDKIEGQPRNWKNKEVDQYTLEDQPRRTGQHITVVTAMEAYERGMKIAPGELPFYVGRFSLYYDEEKKKFRTIIAPFWWKTMPSDDGLAQNTAVYHVGEGTNELLEPTIDNMTYAEGATRFTPATPEEAAEIEAEEAYEREMRNSMQRAIADLGIVEVPPYYVVGQKTWNSTMPWYKQKKAKGTLSQQESESLNWDLLVAWEDKK